MGLTRCGPGGGSRAGRSRQPRRRARAREAGGAEEGGEGRGGGGGGGGGGGAGSRLPPAGVGRARQYVGDVARGDTSAAGGGVGVRVAAAAAAAAGSAGRVRRAPSARELGVECVMQFIAGEATELRVFLFVRTERRELLQLARRLRCRGVLTNISHNVNNILTHLLIYLDTVWI